MHRASPWGAGCAQEDTSAPADIGYVPSLMLLAEMRTVCPQMVFLAHAGQHVDSCACRVTHTAAFCVAPIVC